MKLRGRWGSVADDIWDMEDAEVVCQQLGCGSAAGAYHAADSFGKGDGPVSLALINCHGAETALWDCEVRGWGPYNALHDYDTAVVCQGRSWVVLGEDAPVPAHPSPTTPACLPAGFARLVGGDGACAGRLEVRRGRAWVGVCEDRVDIRAAQVVCRELGCGAALAVPGSGRFEAGTGPLWEGGFECTGTEPLLSACARQPADGQGCAGHASIICSSKHWGHWGMSGGGPHTIFPPQHPFCHSLHGFPAGGQRLGVRREGGGGGGGDMGVPLRHRLGPA